MYVNRSSRVVSPWSTSVEAIRWLKFLGGSSVKSIINRDPATRCCFVLQNLFVPNAILSSNKHFIGRQFVKKPTCRLFYYRTLPKCRLSLIWHFAARQFVKKPTSTYPNACGGPVLYISSSFSMRCRFDILSFDKIVIRDRTVAPESRLPRKLINSGTQALLTFT
jgi:hypothetical protein